MSRSSAEPVRLAYAAAHVVMRESYRSVPHSPDQPGRPEEIAEHVDWEATFAIRRHLAGLGFGVAEAMDTAQRFQLGWESARRLIEGAAACTQRTSFAAGAGTDHVDAVDSEAALVEAVVFQARVIQEAGGIVVVLPMPWLSRNERPPDAYVEVYGEIVRRLQGPVFVHWLGEMFLPELRGYFPGDSFERVMALDADKVRGAKLSLLDPAREVAIRRQLLQRDQILLTGDDFHFARLMRGGNAQPGCAAPPPVQRWTAIGGQRVALGDFSHALLGVLDAIALPAARALDSLARGDGEAFTAQLAPCEELGQCLFQEPTRHYKAGLAFLAWLNGLQENPMLVNHEEQARDSAHYRRAFEIAGKVGALGDQELAARRMASLSD